MNLSSVSTEDHIEHDYYDDANPEFEDYLIKHSQEIKVYKLTETQKRLELAMTALGLISFLISIIILMHFCTKRSSGIKSLV